MWHSAEPFCATNLLHHQLSPHQHQQQGLCAGAKPVWCRHSPPANKSWHLEEVRRERWPRSQEFPDWNLVPPEEAAGWKTRIGNVGLDGGDVAGDGCLKQHGSVIGGVTWWQVVFPMTCLYKASTLRSKATQACQLPPPGHPLKNCPLLCYRSSLTHKRDFKRERGKVDL